MTAYHSLLSFIYDYTIFSLRALNVFVDTQTQGSLSYKLGLFTICRELRWYGTTAQNLNFKIKYNNVFLSLFFFLLFSPCSRPRQVLEIFLNFRKLILSLSNTLELRRKSFSKIRQQKFFPMEVIGNGLEKRMEIKSPESLWREKISGEK